MVAVYTVFSRKASVEQFHVIVPVYSSVACISACGFSPVTGADTFTSQDSIRISSPPLFSAAELSLSSAVLTTAEPSVSAWSVVLDSVCVISAVRYIILA